MADFEVKIDLKRIESILASIADVKGKWIPILKGFVSSIGLKDVLGHFKAKQGPSGPWPQRSRSTQMQYWEIQQGKREPPPGFQRGVFSPNNELLVLTGDLRKNFLPTNIRNTADTVTLFNPISYASKHDQGVGVPQRQFMWLSNSAMDQIEKGFIEKLLK